MQVKYPSKMLLIYTSRKMKFKKYDYERVTTNTAVHILLYLRLANVGGGRRERNFATSILTFGCTPRKACSEMECEAAFPNLNTSQVTAANVCPLHSLYKVIPKGERDSPPFKQLYKDSNA